MKKKIYTRKRHLIQLIGLITILLGTFDEVMAASYTKTFTANATVTFTQVSGTTKFKVTGDDTEYTDIGAITLNTSGITVTFKFNSGTFYINGRINVFQGHLIVQPNGNKNPILKRKSNYDDLFFYVNNTTTTAVADAHLDIKGTSSSYKIVIDGNATWSISGSNANGFTATKSSGVTAQYPFIYMRAGRGEFQYVDFQNAWNDGGSFQGGAFRIYTVNSGNTPSTSRNYVLIDHCTMKKCYCKGQAGAMQLGGPKITSNSLVKLTYSTIEECFSKADLDSGGGIFRTGGNSACDLTLEDCTLQNNKSNSSGAITWNSGYAPLTLTRCTFTNNYCSNNGGALSLYSAATITGCTFTGNYAVSNGGAIFYYTYGNSETNLPNYTPQNGTLSIDATTKIQNNTAGNNGGGVWITIRPINCLNASGNTYTVFKNNAGTQYEVHLEINGATISGNTAGQFGGGIYLQRTTDIYKSDVNLNYGTIEKNTATSNGGGIYVTSKVDGTVVGTCPYSRTNLNVNVGKSGTSTKATVSGNQANNGGGIYVTGKKLVFKVYANAVIGKSGTGNANQAIATTGAGGGIYFNGTEDSGSYGSFTMYGGNIDYNTSKKNGAGIYIGNGTFTIQGGNITYNKSESGSGGGVFVNPAGTGASTTLNSTSAALSVSNNEAVHGGGIFVNQGSLTVTKNTNNLTINNNVAKTADTGSGGGVFARGTVTISGATISGNKAEGSLGGGIYTESDQITVQSSASITGNKAVDGAGLYAASGNITIQGNSTLTSNVASGNGGGIYSAGGTVTVKATTVTTEILKGNSAKYGGGIYAAGGTVDFSDGVISNNSASQDGGGIYIPVSGKLTMKGTAKLTGNHVPAGKKGGGVYLAGVVEVGSASKAASKVIAEDNYAGSSYQYGSGTNNRNNIYLPDPEAIPYTSPDPHVDVITVVENGLTSDSHIGFSVPHNFVPVIYCAYSGTSRAYLDSYLVNGAMEGVVFEDSEKYSTMHSLVSPYDPDHIYLSNLTWVQEVTSQPASGFSIDGSGNVTISTNEGLAWLISYVNGLNNVDGGAHSMSGNTVTLTADVDMDEYSWVPIGFTGKTFQGTFNGNGHTVKGIDCVFLGESGATQTGLDLGMFGNVGGSASISNVFLENAYYSSMTVSDKAFVFGGVVAKLGGTATVFNTVVKAEMESVSPTAVMGGVVGQLSTGEVHSSAAMPKMTGSTMGGLVGINSGDLFNCFANPQFKYNGTANTYYVGGLVAENEGTVENNYVRFSRTQTLTNALFGQLAGNNEGSIAYCYTPETYTSDVPSTIVHTGSATSDTYKIVDAPYLYNRPNDNLVGSTGKTLTEKLNTWVSAQGSASDYAFWKRTTAGGYATSAHAGNINDDYPIHKMKGFSCAASSDGLFIHYKASLNRMVSDYNGLSGGGTIWLYDSPTAAPDTNETVNVENDDDVILYIDEDASLLQASGKVLKAFTGQTIDGTPRSWHFVSSSLEDSGMGFSYTNDATFNWNPDPCGLLFSGADDAAVFPSDMPAVTSMDFYCFYEPEYHWINFKRNSNSHWHMNAHEVSIEYDNETELLPGKGYLISVDKDLLLQNRGTLNNGDVPVDLDYTISNAWAGLLGYNLIGNPYQSYLDFGEFARVNSSLWYDGSKGREVEPTYAVYDGTMGGYVQYKEGASRGSKSASGMLNMHQGFMIRTSGTTTATFTNAMRSNDGAGTTLREGQPAFPLINFTVTDDEGVNDFAVLELGRDVDEGAEKLRANDSKGWLYLHYGDENYGILFRTEVENYQPLWFEAEEAGTYRLSWETVNAEFEALTLIDNITGVTTDMLARDSYTFEATPDQYASRFKVVVGEYKDIEEYDGSSTGSGTLAFQMGDEIVVNGEGRLEIVDVTGRVILCKDASYASTISKAGMTPGVYIIRLTDGKETKVQKMIIE